MAIELDGAVALVTGGANGIGACLPCGPAAAAPWSSPPAWPG